MCLPGDRDKETILSEGTDSLEFFFSPFLMVREFLQILCLPKNILSGSAIKRQHFELQE